MNIFLGFFYEYDFSLMWDDNDYYMAVIMTVMTAFLVIAIIILTQYTNNAYNWWVQITIIIIIFNNYNL